MHHEDHEVGMSMEQSFLIFFVVFMSFVVS